MGSESELWTVLTSLFPGMLFKVAVAGLLLILLLYSLVSTRRSAGAIDQVGAGSLAAAGGSTKLLQLPPGPRPWPVVGNLLHVGRVPHVGMMKLTSRYGPLVYLRLGSIPHVVTDDPVIIKEFLKVQDHIFASRPGNVILAELLTYGGKDIGFAPYGQHWRNMRKICTLELFAPKRVDGFQRLRTEEINNILGRTYNKARGGEIVDLRDAFNDITSNMMTRMLIGKRYFGPGNAGPEVGDKVKSMIAEGIIMMNGFNISDYLPFLRFLDIQGQERRMKQIMHHIDSVASELLDEFAPRAGKKQETFGDILVMVPGENGEKQLHEDVLKAVMVDMMAAGTDTPGVSSEWAMSELLNDPVLFQNIRDEIDSVVGVDRLVEEADLVHFRQLRAVLKESFRLHPVGAILIPHLAMEDACVNGYLIPKNTRVLINVFALNRNPSVWDQPEVFKPDRHLRGEEPVEFIDSECRMIPFGAGRRMCPAASLGLIMVLLGLSHMVHAFDWEISKPLNMERAAGKMVRAEPLMACAKPRLSPHLYPRQA